MEIKSFVFSGFAENTYVLYDISKEAVIIDPGCLESHEKDKLASFIRENSLNVKYLLQTHTHIDHIFGSAWVKKKYEVPMLMHQNEMPILSNAELICKAYGILGFEPLTADSFLEDGDTINFGESTLEVIYVPGHSPGHIAFVSREDKFVIGGDCLFLESIGRTDLPLCNHQDLLNSIKNKFYTLPDDFQVFAGHMEPTTIGHEKKFNPFIKA